MFGRLIRSFEQVQVNQANKMASAYLFEVPYVHHDLDLFKELAHSILDESDNIQVDTFEKKGTPKARRSKSGSKDPATVEWKRFDDEWKDTFLHQHLTEPKKGDSPIFISNLDRLVSALSSLRALS